MFDLEPIAGEPPRLYRLTFHCRGLVVADGQYRHGDDFQVAICFPGHYLRKRFDNPLEIMVWLKPTNVWHPNISPPVICPGPIAPGTSLVELIYQVYEIISYQKLTPHEGDALNRDACVWARDNMQRFPIDDRPLKRRN